MNETNLDDRGQRPRFTVLRAGGPGAARSCVDVAAARGGSDVVRLEIAGSAQNFETELKRWAGTRRSAVRRGR